MKLRETINGSIEQLKEIDWELVQNNKNCASMYKISEETNLEGFCQIEKRNNSYNISLIIKDPSGKIICHIENKNKIDKESKAARFFKRFAAGEGECYLSRETNDPLVKAVYDKYKKLKKQNTKK